MQIIFDLIIISLYTDICRKGDHLDVKALMMPAMMLIMNGITILIVWVGSHQIDAGQLMIGDMMAFICLGYLCHKKLFYFQEV